MAKQSSANESESGVTDVSVTRRLSDDDLRNIDSFEAAVEAVQGILGAEVVDAAEVLGNGFTILEDKDTLIGKPCLFLSWNFNESDTIRREDGSKGVFVSATVVVKVNREGAVERYIVNDGGTGICAQLQDYSIRTGSTAGLLVRKGLRRSDYEKRLADDSVTSGTTFYLDTSA